MVEEFRKVFGRDLEKLKMEIQSFEQESNLWKTTGHINNSAGNLCLHLVGNLSAYIAKNLGKYDYTRDRDAEFSAKNVSLKQLVGQVEVVKEWIEATLNRLDAGDLDTPYPENVLGYPMTKGFFLMHLFGHLSYHLGQINYLRRALE